MGMTINEIIEQETLIAQEFQKVFDTHMVNDKLSLEELYCDDTEVIEEKLEEYKERLDYHSTITNIMHKYQKITEIVEVWDKDLIDYEGHYGDDYMEKIQEVLKDGSN